MTSLGWHVRGARPRIVPIDALADRYRALLTEFRCAPPVWTEACDGEAIAARFPPGSFDVAHIRNALDHCYDPLAVLAGALAVLRPGGTLAIAGFKDEAEHGGYDGLHQWNVRGENDDVIVWRPRERHSVRETFAGAIASMTVRQSEASRWVSAVIRKR